MVVSAYGNSGVAIMSIKIYADGADLASITDLQSDPRIQGFTTNPSLMRHAGVVDYLEFASRASEISYPKPISFEVFADESNEMVRQALRLSALGENVFVKIPVTNSEGISCAREVEHLSKEGIKLNITAIFTEKQFDKIASSLDQNCPAILSVFAGRIADTGVDPVPILQNCARTLEDQINKFLLWASTRELFNIQQAEIANCDIITIPNDMLPKLSLLGKNLEEFSLETVKMFLKDAKDSGYAL